MGTEKQMETEIDSSTEQVLVAVERIVISITYQTFSLVPLAFFTQEDLVHPPMSLSIQYSHLMAGEPRLRKASDLPMSQAESWDLNLACVGPLQETGARTQKRWPNSIL